MVDVRLRHRHDEQLIREIADASSTLPSGSEIPSTASQVLPWVHQSAPQVSFIISHGLNLIFLRVGSEPPQICSCSMESQPWIRATTVVLTVITITRVATGGKDRHQLLPGKGGHRGQRPAQSRTSSLFMLCSPNFFNSLTSFSSPGKLML